MTQQSTNILEQIEAEFHDLQPTTRDIFEYATVKNPDDAQKLEQLQKRRRELNEQIKKISAQQRELRIAQKELLSQKTRAVERIRSLRQKLRIAASPQDKSRLKKAIRRAQDELFDIQGKFEMSEEPLLLMENGEPVLDETGKPMYVVRDGEIVMRKVPARNEFGEIILQNRPDGRPWVGKITLINRKLFGFNSELKSEVGVEKMRQADALYGQRWRLQQELQKVKGEILEIARLPYQQNNN